MAARKPEIFSVFVRSFAIINRGSVSIENFKQCIISVRQ